MQTTEEDTQTTDKDVMSIYQVWRNNDIYWIKTYKTLLKYVSRDYSNIFQPIITGEKSGKRYFVKRSNIRNFIEKFESNKLSE